KAGVSLDHEAEPSVELSITATDTGGLSITRSFAIAVNDVNEAPTALDLRNASVPENAAGAAIGTLTVTDPDVGDTHTFTVSDTDIGGLSISRSFTIAVNDVNEAPTALDLSNASVPENAAGAAIGTLTVTDPDAGDTHTFTVSDSRFEVVGTTLKLKDGVSL